MKKRRRENPIQKFLKALIAEYAFAVMVAVFGALTIRIFIFEAYRIPTEFMSPTLEAGDHIFVSKTAYQKYYFFGDVLEPKRGEVVVFAFPVEPKKFFIKRVVAVSGDKIEIKNKVLYVNDRQVTQINSDGSLAETLEDFRYQVKWDKESEEKEQKDITAATVPKGQLFLLGDNRSKGQDSRNWGFVPFSLIKGKATWIWFSRHEGDTKWKRIFKKID